MGKLSQALAGGGAAIQQVGLMGLKNTMEEKRQKSLAKFTGEIQSKANAGERLYRTEEAKRGESLTASEGALNRASRERIASVKTPKDPRQWQETNAMGETLTFRDNPGTPGRPDRFDQASGRFVSAGQPQGIPLEEALPIAEELANEFTTLTGGDMEDIGMPEEDLAQIFAQDIAAGVPLETISTKFAAARARGEIYTGAGSSQDQGAAPSGAPSGQSAYDIVTAAVQGKGTLTPAASSGAQPAPSRPPSSIQDLEQEAGERARMSSVREGVARERSAFAERLGLSPDASAEEISRTAQRLASAARRVDQALGRERGPRKKDLMEAIKFAEMNGQREQAAKYNEILTRSAEFWPGGQ